MPAKRTRPYLAAAIHRAKAFVANTNAQTACAYCGAQPVEWHNPDHVVLNRQSYRISNLASKGRAIEVIEAELARCTPLCRRCHMREDGRLEKLRARNAEPRQLRAPLPCRACARPYKPLRKGLCGPCYLRDARKFRAAERGVSPPKSQCRRGHPYSGANLSITPKPGQRYCRACRVAFWSTYARPERSRRSDAP